MGKNFLFKHWPIRLSKDRRYLEHADGTPFFWLADTWWYGMTSRLSIPIFEKLAKLRAKQGFTVIQIVVGIPPETQNYDMPLDKTYFEEVEKKLNILWENNLVPCIVGGWGHHIDILGEQRIKTLWEKILEQVTNKPAILCLCGEADIFPSRVRFFKKLLLKNRLRKWERIARFIKERDRQHLLTVHIQSQTSSRKLFGNPDWIDINSIQSGHSIDRIGFMTSVLNEESKENMPIINLEPWYEGILGNFGEYEQRLAFWMCILSGAKGHSYGAHGVWQMSKKGQNFMKHWGDSYWKRSLGFSGAEQLGLAKRFLEKYEWWRLESCFEKVIPHWTENDVYLPVAAKIEDRHFFIYIPRVGEVSPSTRLRAREIGVKDLNSRTFYKASFIDPKSMRVIDSFKFRGKEYIIPVRKTDTEDLLIVISLFTSEEPKV